MPVRSKVKLRGRPTILPPWWLIQANKCWDRLRGETKWGVQRLADELTKTVDRKLNGETWKWDRKTVERFLNNQSPTEELVDAFCKLFPDELTAPTYVARTLDEAKALASVARGFGSSLDANRVQRSEALREARAKIEASVEDQRRALGSADDAIKDKSRESIGRRTRGMGRGRSSSS